jgi:cystathionine beta-lyase/cystathionine gamma-synthase
MAAVNALIMASSSLNNKPAHLILPDDCYHGVPSQLITSFLDSVVSGVTWEVADMTNVTEVEGKIKAAVGAKPGAKPGDDGDRNVVLWLETPSNPLCKVTPIQQLTDLAKGINEEVLVVVDSTWSPPVLTQPLKYGADAVLHSATK